MLQERRLNSVYGYDIGSGCYGRINEETDEFIEFATEEEYKEYLKEN